MATLKAVFDGNVFVPCKTVDLPAGTEVEIVLPSAPASVPAALPSQPREGPAPVWPPGLANMSPEQIREWEELCQQLEASEPPFATFDEYLRYRRMQP